MPHADSSEHEEAALKLVESMHQRIIGAVSRRVAVGMTGTAEHTKKAAAGLRKLAAVNRKECAKESKKIREKAKELDAVVKEKKAAEPKKKRGRKPKA